MPDYQMLKWPLMVADGLQVLQMPRGSEIKFVGEQGERICLWTASAVDARVERREFVVVGTGHIWPPGFGYVGTVKIAPFVWHVLESGLSAEEMKIADVDMMADETFAAADRRG
jgi:hypothetical protein